MSTRCTVWFHEVDRPADPVAIVYRHFDGYPDAADGYGMLHDLAAFFEDVAEQTNAVGYDAGHLAAQYVVWQSAHYNRDDDGLRRGEGKGGPLNFSSVYLMRGDPGDIEYRYHVHATKPNYTGTPEERAKERPTITYDERIGFTDEWRTVRPPTPEERERAEFLRKWERADEDARALMLPYLGDQPRLWLEATAAPADEPTDEPAAVAVLAPPAEEPADEEPEMQGGFQIVGQANGLMFSRDPHRENGVYEIVRPEVDNNQHVVICGDDGQYTVLHYLSDGDGFGRSVYLASHRYKTLRGARKKAHEYLTR